jgi:hypothetical protein
VSLHLRWPTALETSGPWLRALAASRPTIVIDLLHQADVPALDPRTWEPPPRGRDAITVAIDILDEDHSLGLAMDRLAADAALRTRLGDAGFAYWRAHHTVESMIETYEQLLPRAAAAGAPPERLPPALAHSSRAHFQALLADTGGLTCEFS